MHVDRQKTIEVLKKSSVHGTYVVLFQNLMHGVWPD